MSGTAKCSLGLLEDSEIFDKHLSLRYQDIILVQCKIEHRYYSYFTVSQERVTNLKLNKITELIFL